METEWNSSINGNWKTLQIDPSYMDSSFGFYSWLLHDSEEVYSQVSFFPQHGCFDIFTLFAWACIAVRIETLNTEQNTCVHIDIWSHIQIALYDKLFFLRNLEANSVCIPQNIRRLLKWIISTKFLGILY